MWKVRLLPDPVGDHQNIATSKICFYNLPLIFFYLIKSKLSQTVTNRVFNRIHDRTNSNYLFIVIFHNIPHNVSVLVRRTSVQRININKQGKANDLNTWQFSTFAFDWLIQHRLGFESVKFSALQARQVDSPRELAFACLFLF